MQRTSGTGSAVKELCQTRHFNQCGIDFIDAIESHTCWHNKLQRHINGETSEECSPSIAGVDDFCGLGRWLRGTGRIRFGHFSAFRRLDIEHAEFHYCAGQILANVLEGQQATAATLLSNEFAQATHRVLMAIVDMQETLQQTANTA